VRAVGDAAPAAQTRSASLQAQRGAIGAPIGMKKFGSTGVLICAFSYFRWGSWLKKSCSWTSLERRKPMGLLRIHRTHDAAIRRPAAMRCPERPNGARRHECPILVHAPGRPSRRALPAAGWGYRTGDVARGVDGGAGRTSPGAHDRGAVAGARDRAAVSCPQYAWWPCTLLPGAVPFERSTQGLAIIPLRCRHRGPAASAAGGKEASSGIVPGPSIRPAQVPVPALRARAGPGRDSPGRDGNDPRAPCPRFTSSRPTSRVPGMTTNVQSYFGCSGALFKCKWPLALPVGRAPVDRLAAAHRRQSPPANIDESQSLWRAPAGVLVRGDCVRRGARYRMRSALDASFSSIKLLAARRLAPLPRGICINLHITYAHTYKYTNQRYIHAHNPRT